MRAKEKNKLYVVAGLGYGDEGKGTIVDFLTNYSDAKTVLRYCGGPQAAHHVVKGEEVHCFSQFGAGTLAKNIETVLSKYMYVSLDGLRGEAESLREKGVENPYENIKIDSDCFLVTQFNKIINRMQELSRGKNRNGSCGLGVGITVFDSETWGESALKFKDVFDEESLDYKLDFFWRLKLDLAEQIVDEHSENEKIQEYYQRIKNPGLKEAIKKEWLELVKDNSLELIDNVHTQIKYPAVFEGAHGLLIDRYKGFWPHCTKTNNTYENAIDLVEDLKGVDVKKIGIFRAYSSRHGAGPFVTEDSELTDLIPDMHNGTNEWQAKFRIGWFDLVAARYALDCMGGEVESLAITGFDRLTGMGHVKVCTSYEYLGDRDVDDYFEYYESNGAKMLYRMKVPVENDCEEQRKVTEILNECNPIYTHLNCWDENSVTGNCKEYVSFLETELKVPVSIASFGPESEDKIVLKPEYL